MPELPEIKRYAYMINKRCKGLSFNSVSSSWVKHAAIAVPWGGKFTISAEARGKELMITLTNPSSSGQKMTVVFTHGLVGSWEFTSSSAVSKYALVQFTNGANTLSFVDMQKMGGWNIGTWGKDRGPDPVNEHDAFCKNIMDSLKYAVFNKDICEVLLEQPYFNGIGNYLRAEILHRANINPFTKARDIFKFTNLSQGFDKVDQNSDRGLILLYLCKAIPLEVLEKGLNKYGNDQEKSAFEAWLTVYNKGESKKDKKGRTIHYTNAQMAGISKVSLYKPSSRTAEEALAKFEGDSLPSSSSTTSTSTTVNTSTSSLFTFGSSNTNAVSFVDTSSKFGEPKTATKPVQLSIDVSKIDRICDLSRSMEASLLPGYSCLLEHPEENQFHFLQVISVGNGAVFWQRFGPKTSLGVQLRQGPSDKNHAIAQFEGVFKDKTGRSWEERALPLRQVGKYEVKEYNMSTSAAPFNLQTPQTNAHQATEVGGMDRAEFNTLDPMAKLLVMLASMGRKGLLTAEQKSHLKYKILNEQSPILYNALEAYERDNTEAELADTFARVLAFEKGERLNDQFVPAHPVPLADVQRNLTSQFGGADSFHGFGKTEPAPPKTAPSQALTLGITSTLTDPSWRALLEPEFSKPYFKKLEKFVEKQYLTKEVFPPRDLIFNAFNLCPLNKIKVVIIGQDPYHDNGQAHGLCFSVMRGVPVPPSLKNIYKELKSDVGFEPPEHGNLESWAKQGVLLLNTVLTVEAHKANSHKSQGWETFTDEVIRLIGLKTKNVVFLLWGAPAHQKEKLLKVNNHHILKTAHPSPLSAHAGFIGCKHFSMTNTFLKQQGSEPINWQLPQ
jgi:uracil-DNA glycosylase